MEIKKAPKKNELLEKVGGYMSKQEKKLVSDSYDFAEKAHEGQSRMAGGKFINHPAAVAYILADMGLESTMISAALLHDVIEDTSYTHSDIKEKFSEEIADIVEGDTKIGELKYKGVERYVENWRRLFMAMAKDIRVMIIKLADRAHNIQTIDVHSEDKIYKRALESLEIYAPTAGRLGMDVIKEEIENKAFPHVYPEEYKKTKELTEKELDEKLDYFLELKQEVKKTLKQKDIKLEKVQTRKKSLYEIYKESQKNYRDLKLYDVIAINIVVSSTEDCYDTLGVIHSNYKPLRERIKDYISQPKPNGYQALHTTVFSEDKMIEFQIRSTRMNQEAKYGAATYWSDKIDQKSEPDEERSWAQAFGQIEQDIKGLDDLEQIKVDYLKSKIFAFTPKGEVINLPEDSTPIDFAYEISEDLGNNCASARVNNKKVNLDTKLKNGDVVEIISKESRDTPKKEWLNSVKTSKAKQKIKSSLEQKDSKWLNTEFFK
ncbi:MAG: bifunctional (p)ppGpp synthetase/guanosine-3',5'-bis(diphosphate) 3'-pyrophosphohydrolase [Candidatus Magasanikbacteria bacterium]